MKTLSQMLRETFSKHLPYIIQVTVTCVAIWFVHTYITKFFSDGDYYNQQRQLFICYLLIACTSTLWARMTYLHQKVMKKLEQLEKEKSDK